jgi:hypothetical protein
MVGVMGTNWNQIKRELITMWQIVKQVRRELLLHSKQVYLNHLAKSSTISFFVRNVGRAGY